MAAEVEYPAKEPKISELNSLKPIENKFRGDDDPTYETWKHQIKGRLMQNQVLYHIQINDLVAPEAEEAPAKKISEQRAINRVVIASFLTDCISGPPLKYSALVIRLLNLKNRFERAGGDMDDNMKCNILLKALVSRKWDQTTLHTIP